MFDIEFTGETVDTEGEILHHGIISLNGRVEGFLASFSFWSKDDYQKQWIKAASRLLQPNSHSAFITCLYNPATGNSINWWPAWRISQYVVFQEHILPLDITLFPDVDEDIKALWSKFSLENPYAALGDRISTHSKECQDSGICRRPRLFTKVPDEEIKCCPSEWSMGIDSIEDFLKRRSADWK